MFFLKNNLAKILNRLIKVYLFILPWQTVWIIHERSLNGYKWQYGTAQFFLSELFVWVLFGVFFIWSLRKIKEKFKNNSINFSWTHDRVFVLFVLIFIIYSLLSILWSYDKDMALQHSLYFIETFLLFFIILLGPISKKEVIIWLAAGSIMPAILGIAQFVIQSTWASKWLGLAVHPSFEAGASIVNNGARWIRAYGTLQHPNIFGGYLALALILLLDYLLNNSITGFYKKISHSLIIILLSSALFFTFSRSAWLVLVLAIAMFIYLGFRNKAPAKSFFIFLSMPVLIFFICAIIYFPLIKTRVYHFTSSEMISTQERISGMWEAKEIFLKHPWLGTGSGNYTAASYLLNNKRPGWEYQPAHNIPALFASEMGTVGVIIFIGLVIAFARFYLLNKIGGGQEKIEALFLIIPLIPALMLDHYFFSGYFGMVLFGIYGGVICKHDVHS